MTPARVKEQDNENWSRLSANGQDMVEVKRFDYLPPTSMKCLCARPERGATLPYEPIGTAICISVRARILPPGGIS